MALRRMISTRFFKDRDIINLSSKDTQLILIGLVLAADDEGREVAHAGLLGCEMDYPAEQVEAALQELAASDLLVLYQVGKHRYYQLTRVWREWQTLGGHKTPSRYPAPPAPESPESHETEAFANSLGKIRGNDGESSGKSRGNSLHFPDQLNRSESKLSEEEGEGCHPSPPETSVGQPRKVVPFPNSRPSNDNADGEQTKTVTLPHAEVTALTQQIARILKLPATESLTRLVGNVLWSRFRTRRPPEPPGNKTHGPVHRLLQLGRARPT